MNLRSCEPKAQRALERRFGQSVLPIRFRRVGGEGSNVLRAIDDETGSYVDVDCGGWRIRVVNEHDAAA